MRHGRQLSASGAVAASCASDQNLSKQGEQMGLQDALTLLVPQSDSSLPAHMTMPDRTNHRPVMPYEATT